MVGDPSGRTKEREGLSADTLERNKLGLEENLRRIFHNAQTLGIVSEAGPSLR